MMRFAAILCALGALAFTGCTTVAKQVYWTAVGPQGEYLVIHENADMATMRKYRHVEVVDFVNPIPAIKPNVASAVQGEIVARLKKMDADRVKDEKPRRLDSVEAVDSLRTGSAAAPTLVITGTLLDITSDKIPGQKIIFGGNHLIARVMLTDKATGKVLVEANLRGLVKSAADWDEESLATGMGKGAQELLEDVCGWKEQDKEREAAK